jgi:hypothetical protein
MIVSPKKQGAPGALTPLAVPKPVRVRASGGGTPQELHLSRWLPVTRINDCWRIDDEWWRPRFTISRRYWQVLLEDGRCVTLFQDLRTGSWYRQQY